MTDEQIRNMLKLIDESEAECTAWEGDFLETVLYRQDPLGHLTVKQRTVALEMIEKYKEFL